MTWPSGGVVRKSSIRKLPILELEDTYIDTPTLINKLGKMIWNVK